MSWIRIRHVGPQDKPIPTIWISTEHLALQGPAFNQQVVLTPSAYEAVLKATREFADSLSEHSVGSTEFGSLEVVESANGDERFLFTVARSGSCRYLTQIVNAVRSAAAELTTVMVNVGRRLACSDPAFDRV